MGQQAMNAGNSHIGQLFHLIVEHAGSHRGFSGNRQVGSSGADDKNFAPAEILFGFLLQAVGVGDGIVLTFRVAI